MSQPAGGAPQSYGPPFGPPPYGQPPYGAPSGPPPYGPPPRKDAGLAVGSMVLGILALVFSWVPVVNNVAAIVALVGLGLGIPALILSRRGTHGGTGLAITGLVTSVIALVLVVLTQMLFAQVFDEVDPSFDESSPDSVEVPAEVEEEAAPTPETVPLGVPAQVGDYEVTVDAFEMNADVTVAAANQFNDPPTGQYVITQLTVTYIGADEGTPGWDLTAILHGTDSRQYKDSECSAVLPDDAMNAPTLNSGGSDTFQFCMDVPPTAIEGAQLSIEPTMSFDEERVYYAIR